MTPVRSATRGGRIKSVTVGILTAAAMSVGVISQPAWAAPKFVPLGSAQAVPPGSSDIGSSAAHAALDLDVVMAPRDPAALSAFVENLYDSHSPEYHHFLAPGQFGPMFGAAPSTVKAVTSALSALGLTPGRVSSSDLILPVSTTTAQAESAFRVRIHKYRLASGRVAFANTGAPVVPSAIAQDLVGIVGLSDVEVPVSNLASSATQSRPSFSPQIVPNASGTSGPTPCTDAKTDGTTNSGYTADQLAHAYGFDTGAYHAGNLGAGVTVALLELEPYTASDISTYETCYGISTSVNVTNVDGGASGAQIGEAAADIETVAGLAPKATINVYGAPFTTTGWLDLYKQIANDDTAQVVSTSWGYCEPGGNGTLWSDSETVFVQMASQGQSMLAATGDNGSEACLAIDSTNKTLAVQDPGSDPFVTGVGGSSLTAIGPPPTETVWNEGSVSEAGGGGGISTHWLMPDWQKALGINSYSSGTPCSAPSGSYCREVPDVSASADSVHGYGYVLYIKGSWGVHGGTSLATPLWASLTALVDEGCSSRSGLLNSALYTHSSDLNDITSGNNDSTGTNNGYYPAAVGYDMASGLGSPTSALFQPGVLCTPAAMTVAPSSVSTGSAHNTLTFSFTSPTGGLKGGEIDMAVPTGWSAPSTTATDAGYVTSTCGTVSVSGMTIQVTGVTLTPGYTCDTAYGDQTGTGPGATAPASAGSTFTFTTTERSSSSDTLTPLASSPEITVNAADGSGTMTVSPSTVAVGSSGITLTFTYSAATGGLTEGVLAMTVPTGWSAPSAVPADAGYVTSTCGTVGVQPSGFVVTGVVLTGGSICTITYGDTTSSGPGVSAPPSPCVSSFDSAELSDPSGFLTPLTTSPDVMVAAATGSGTMTVSPGTVAANSSGNTLTFTYTAAAGGLADGAIEVEVPSGWSAPSATASAAGYVTSTCGSAAVYIETGIAGIISVPGVTLTGGSTCTITYGDMSSGPGATAPSSTGPSSFLSFEKSTSANVVLGALASSPAVHVTTTDGTGTMTVAPFHVSAGSGGNTLYFTYTAAAILSAGEIDVAVPTGWSAPSGTAAAGHVTSTCGSVLVSGMTIKVTGVTSIIGASCAITYGDPSGGPGATATAPASPTGILGTPFTTTEKSNSFGSLTPIASSPAVNVNAPDGSGTMTVSPISASAGSGGNTLTFTYTAPTGGLFLGEIDVTVPTGWSAPSTTPSDPGYVRSDCGTPITVSGPTIQASVDDLAATAHCTITYGSKVSLGPGADAPGSTGTSFFTTSEKSTSYGTLVSLTSSPSVVVNSCASGTTSCQSDTSTTPTGTASATNTATTATASGEGSISVGQYGSDPVGPPTFPASGVYLDVEVASGSSFSNLTITDCNLNGATSLEWWNGSAWLVASPESSPAGSPPCVTTTLDSTSSPTIADLTGTVFAGALPATTALGAPTGLGATPGNTTATLSWTAPSSNGGSAILGYDVYEGTTSGGESTTPVNGTTLIGATSYAVTGLTNGTTYYFDVQAVNSVGNSVASNEASATPASTPTTGYWMLGSDCTVYQFGFGASSTSPPVITAPPSGMSNCTFIAPTFDNGGYWIVSASGQVSGSGDAQTLTLNSQPAAGSSVVTIAGTHDGKGYWLATSSGQVITAGDAQSYGDASKLPLNKGIVSMVATPNGLGYWLLGGDGGIFTYGDAGFFGSTGNLILNQPVNGIATTPDGKGYVLVARDGGIFASSPDGTGTGGAFGDGAFYGSLGMITLAKPIVGIVPTVDGKGYLMVASDGGVFASSPDGTGTGGAFGDAVFLGSLGANPPSAPIVGIAP